MAGDPVLSVRDLTVRIGTRRGVARVVNGVSYDVYPGETLAVVGESGSGKSVAALAVLGLLDEAATVAGQVLLDGVDLLAAGERQLRRIRGNEIAMVFQDPMTSLNPVKTIGSQLVEPIELHGVATGAARHEPQAGKASHGTFGASTGNRDGRVHAAARGTSGCWRFAVYNHRRRRQNCAVPRGRYAR